MLHGVQVTMQWMYLKFNFSKTSYTLYEIAKSAFMYSICKQNDYSTDQGSTKPQVRNMGNRG